MTKKTLSIILSALMSVTVFQTPIVAEGGETAEETPEVTEVQETNTAEELTEETEAPREEIENLEEPKEEVQEVTEETPEPEETPEAQKESEETVEEPTESEEPSAVEEEQGEEETLPEETPEGEEPAELTVTEETPEAEETPETPEETPEPEETEEPEEVTLITPEAVTYNGVTVSVSYYSDTFGGKEVTMVVGEPGEKEKAALEALGGTFKAVDITFVDAEGNPVQPEEGKNVSVSLKAEGMENTREYEAVHVDAEGNVTLMDAASEVTNTVTQKVKVGETTRTVEVPAETEIVEVQDYKEVPYTTYELVEKTVEVPEVIGYRYVRKSREVEVTQGTWGFFNYGKSGKSQTRTEYYYEREPYVVREAYTYTTWVRTPVQKTRTVPAGTHTETRVVKEAYTYEETEDVYEDVQFNEVQTTFGAGSFSVYAVVAVGTDGSIDFDETFGADHITVQAPAGAFEEGTVMKIETVDDPNVLANALKALGDLTYNIYGIDISFWLGEQEVEPQKPVKVTWTSDYIKAGDTVVHINDDGTAEKVTAIVQDNKTVFITDQFSTYTTTRIDSIDLNAAYAQAIVFNPSSLTRPATMNSGLLATTHPEFEGYTYVDATYQRQGEPVSQDKVIYLGAFIYRQFDDAGAQIGDDKIFIYYRTEADADNDLIVQLADNETIHLNYETTPFNVTYKVVYDGNTYIVGEDTLPDELADMVVNGPDQVSQNTSYEAAVRVTLPRGYSASVAMSNESGIQAPALGAGSEPNYTCTDGWTVTPNDYPFTIDGTYTISNVTSDITVTVNVTKRTSYQFTAQPAFNTAYFGGTSTARYQQVSPRTTYTFNGNSTEFSFVTRNRDNVQWAMDSLNINKQSVLVPFVDNNSRTASATTTLTSGTVITVTAEYIASGTNSGNRRYTISVSNCYENITITGGNLHNVVDKPEWVLQERENLSEFDYGSSSYLPLVAGEPMTYDGWQNYGNNAWSAWRRGTMVFTPRVIRFKVADGYVNPQIKYVTPEGQDDYRRVGDVTLAASATDFYHLVTSAPDADGYYYFSLKGNSSSTYMGLLSAKAELARYGVSYDAGEVSGATIPEYDYGGYYGNGTLQGYNIEDNTYIAINKSAPTAEGYVFLNYTIQGDTSGTTYAPSQKVPLEAVAQYGVYDASKQEYVIPLVAHWEEKTEESPINVTAHVILDDVPLHDYTTVVPKGSSIYIDIDSETMTEIMNDYNWQLFYDETGSSPFISDVDETNNEVTLHLYSKFYVYHSSTGVLELHTTKECEVDNDGVLSIGTLDITKLVNPDTLYGGYYMDYQGAHEGNELLGKNLVKAAADYDNAYGTLSTQNITTLHNKGAVAIKIKDDTGATVDKFGTPYNPATTASHVGYWDISKAFTARPTTPDSSWYSNRGTEDTAVLQSGGKGTEVTVARAGIYYLKEVPTCYLRNYHQITYNKNSKKLTGLYLFTAIDDTNYNKNGFTLKSTDGKTATVVKTFTITNASGKSVVLKPTTIFMNKGLTGDGYLGYWDVTGSSYYATGSFTILPYWVTPDTIKVDGIGTRTITISDMTKSGITKTGD